MRRLVIPVLVALFTIAPFVMASADAASLWWRKVISTSRTHAGCMRAAGQGARATLTNVRTQPDEASGTSTDGRVYVAVTCVERGANQRAIAIIAGVGDDFNWVKQVAESTAEAVRTSGPPD